jgi:ankyrin repeat protein
MAKIHLDLLSRYQDKRILERALYHLPRTLPDAYGEAMKQVVSRNPTATRYVYWTLYALRPLSVSELRYATNTASNEHDFDAIDFEHTLQRDSGGILTVDGVTGKVCFIHRTAREYLSGAAARVFFPTAQNEIAEACLAAITADEVIDDCYYNGGNAPRSTENGFIEYAAMYWGHHSRDIPEEEKAIQVLIKTFLNKLLWRRPPLQVLTNEPRIPSELGLGKYPQDWTPLHVLAYFGIVVKSQRLLVQGAEIDANDNSYKITPLHCAASRGNEEMVEFLLDNGADGNAVARDGSTGLHLATQYNQRKVMKMLLARRLNSQIANKEGATSLQLAVTTEWDEATVPLLVKNKVDVNIRNIKTGDTALHLAIEWRRQRIILYLLDRGASIEMTNEDGLTPLQLAVKVDNCDAIALLLQRCAQVEARSLSGFTALQLAAQEKHWVAFDLLVIGGADINAWSKEGETLLHEQARKATSLSIALKLLEQGANIEAITAQQGYTPLHCAAAAGNKEMFMFLLERGAKISTLTARGESILHITPPINDDCLDILRTALDYDLDTNASTTEGWTPLHQAIYVGSSPEKSPEFIHLLLQHDADVTARIPTPSAETALHLAATAINPLPEIIPLLLSSGAEINALTADGKTALHLAAERGRESIFRLLYDAGADGSLDAPDSAKADDGHGGGIGNTAFEVALRNPLGRLWFDSEGKLRPPTTKLDLLKRESVGTVIDDGATESRFDDDDTTEDEEEEEDDETEESMSESECQSQSEIDLEESTRGRTRSRGDQKVNGAVAGVSISVVRYETPYVIV